MVQKGEHYRHYKDLTHVYEIIEVGLNSETLEEMVVYKALYQSENYPLGQIWIRPLKMFTERLKDGKLRFSKVL